MQFSRKKIILGIFVLLVIILGVWFFAFLNNEKQGEIIDTTKNLFPFGEIIGGDGRSSGNSQGTIGENGELISQETGDITEPDAEGPRLRQVSDFPTGGFVPIVRVEEEDVIETEIDEEGNTTQTFRTIEVENQYVRYSSIKDASIYESEITPSTLESDILVDNFIPNSEYAHFNKTGKRVVFQYWNKKDHTPESYLARIEKIALNIKPCPFEFSPVNIGDDGTSIIGIHQFLNRNPQTRIARSGINSLGNESSLATESTITAIKNFQSLYQIDIDGRIGPGTKAKMQEVCNKQQENIGKAEFTALDKKYKLSGFFLPQNITSISMSPEGNEFFYLQEDNLGVIGIIRSLTSETKETIFESPFTEWLSDWNTDESIQLTTKPSYATNGFSYALSPDTGRYFKSLPEHKGLTTLVSPDKKRILTMEALDSSISMTIYEPDSGRARPLALQTFPEKCVWSQNSVDVYCGVPEALSYGGEYPDTWYQGLETYNDSLWRIDSNTLEEFVLSDIVTDYSENIDVQKINIDEKNEYLYFIDKNSEFLWSYRLVDF